MALLHTLRGLCTLVVALPLIGALSPLRNLREIDAVD